MFAKCKKLGTVILAGALVFLGTGAGCSKAPTAAAKVVTVWGFDDPDVFKPIIKDYNNQFKDVQVNYVQKAFDNNYELDSLNAIAAGQGPDVWTIPNDWLTRHADKLVPFTESKPGKDALSKIQAKDFFYPSALTAGTIAGKIYGLTPTVDTLRIFYNGPQFDQALIDFDNANKNNKDYRKQIDTLAGKGPLFWDDIVALDKAFTVKNGSTISRSFLATGGGTNTLSSSDILYALFLQNKSKLFSDDGQTAIFNLPVSKASGEQVVPATKALDFYTSFTRPADPNYDFSGSGASSSDAFVAGNAMAIIGYQSYSDYLKQRFPTLKYRQWPMPQILSSSNQDIVDFAKFNMMTVPTASKNQANAWNFIKYATTLDQSVYTSATKRPGSKLNKGNTNLVITDRQNASNIDRLQTDTATSL